MEGKVEDTAKQAEAEWLLTLREERMDRDQVDALTGLVERDEQDTWGGRS